MPAGAGWPPGCWRRPSPPCMPPRDGCWPGSARRPGRRPTRSGPRCSTPSSAPIRRPRRRSSPPGPATGRSTSTPWPGAAWAPPGWHRARSTAAGCVRSATRNGSIRTGASSAPGAWPRSPTSPRAESRPGASATTCASSRPASAPPPRAPAGAAVRASSAEVVDQVDRGQGVGAAGGRVLDLGVVPRLQAGLEREALVHRHRHAEVVLGEGVVLAGLDQQGVEQFGVGGELVAQVEQAAADQAALRPAVQRGAGAAVAGADFAGELGALAVDEAAAEADGQGALVVVGGEVVALVAAVGRDMVARAEAVGTGAGDVVAVGAGLVVAFLDAVAVHVALALGARAQRRQGEAVLPALLFAREAQARVEA